MVGSWAYQYAERKDVEMDGASVAALIDEIAEAGDSCWEIERKLEVHYSERQTPLLAAGIAALQYMLVAKGEEREEECGPFAPMAEFGDTAIPLRISDQDDATKDTWEQVSVGVVNPVAKARFSDLVWVARYGSAPHVAARTALAAYLQQQASELDDMVVADALVRAVEISRELNDSSLQAASEGAALDFVRCRLEEGSSGPGVPLSVLRALVSTRDKERARQVLGVLADARATFSADPWIVEEVAALEASRVLDESKRLEIGSQVVSSWLRAADQADGIVRGAHLQRALECARLYSLSEVADQIRIRIQEDPEPELTEISATVSIDAADLDKFYTAIMGNGDSLSGMRRLGAYQPLPTDKSATETTVRKGMDANPIRYLATLHKVTDDGFLVAKVADPERHFKVAVLDHEALTIEVWGHHCSEILDIINARAIDESADPTLEYFTGVLILPEVRERFIRALHLYRDGHYDEALMTTLPRIEAALRELAKRLGVPVFIEPSGDKPGRYKGIRPLLDGIEILVEERAWIRYFKVLLCEPLGTNLRNRALHGLMPSARKVDAALAIHCALAISNFSIGPREHE